jgi:hypothetical protein
MKKLILLETIGLVIGSFLVFFLSPQEVVAQSLNFWVSKSSVYVNDLIDVSVTTTPTKGNLNITLQTLSSQGGVPVSWVEVNPSSKVCVTDTTGECYFRIKPTQTGTFTLAATAAGYPTANMGSSITVVNRPVQGQNSPFQLQLLSSATGQAGQGIPITVGTTPAQNGVSINFTPATSSSTVLNGNCITANNGSCTITFTPSLSQVGTFKVKAQGTLTCSASSNITTGCGIPSSSDPVLNIDIVVSAAPGSCTINSATFTPSGTQTDSWYTEGAPPEVIINVTGANCAGTRAQISIVEEDFEFDDAIPELDHKEVTFMSNNTFSVILQAGETDCEAWAGANCNYYLKVTTPQGDFLSRNRTGGELAYEGGGLILSDRWVLKRIIDAENVAPAIPHVGEADFSKYTPLAPLPNPDGGPSLTEIDVGSATAFSTYVNYLVKLIIGLAAALAVVMIVWGGIEYMMTELIPEKAAAKKRMLEALLGLLLLLGSWIILNEINPKLFDTDVNLQSTTIKAYEDEREVTAPTTSTASSLFSTSAPGGSVNLCTQGVSSVSTANGTYTVCNSIRTNLQNMMTAASAQGIKLGGWSWRSLNQQVALRTSHCGSTQYDIYDKPSSQCTPPTARPGRSRHESGVAIDFTCNGTTIQATDNACFLWLKQNAGRYGFYNLPSEPWHWSIDGK